MTLQTPYIDLLPPLSTAEQEALAADIAINGVQIPIVIDEEGNILDGHHRYAIEPDAPVRTIDGLTKDEKIAYVLGTNMKRRNLSVEQKKNLHKKMRAIAIALNQANRTQSEIGVMLGVDQSTVSRWLRVTNMQVHNSCLSDSRITIPKTEDPVILERLDSGETQAQLAADYGVTRQAIGKRAEKARKKQEKEQAATIPEPEEQLRLTFSVEPGDIWELGRHVIMCGDAYNPHDVAALIGEHVIDALITDPPYGIGYRPDWNKWDGSPGDFSTVTGDEQEFDPAPFLNYPTVAMFGANYFSNRLPVGGWACWDKRTDVKKDEMFGSPFELAWYRSVHTTRKAIMIRVLHGGVVNADSIDGNNEARWVATQKPIAVMEQLLDSLVNPDELVYDPFIGSGTTLLACESRSMQCRAMDIEPECVMITLERWRERTGLEPVLRGNNVRD